MAGGISAQGEVGCGIHRHGRCCGAGTLGVGISVGYTDILRACSSPVDLDAVGSGAFGDGAAVHVPAVIAHAVVSGHRQGVVDVGCAGANDSIAQCQFGQRFDGQVEGGVFRCACGLLVAGGRDGDFIRTSCRGSCAGDFVVAES